MADVATDVNAEVAADRARGRLRHRVGAAGELVNEYRAGAREQADACLAAAAALAGRHGVTAQVLHVEDRAPAEAIIDTAREHGCDLVVMASHGRSGLGRLLLGSQTQAVVGRSSVPVLVVR